jgi:hypothetical protein
MNSQKVSVKLYAGERTNEPLDSYIPIFHRWIRENRLGEMLIDVADYTHVPQGIGVLLVGHGIDVAIDQGEGPPGLLLVRKRALPPGAALVTDALRLAIEAAKLIDQDSEVEGPKKFSTQEILFRFPDRLYFRNDDASFQEIRERVEAALKELLPGVSYQLSRVGEPREPLSIVAQG